jgi:hypothetical protein
MQKHFNVAVNERILKGKMVHILLAWSTNFIFIKDLIFYFTEFPVTKITQISILDLKDMKSSPFTLGIKGH